MSGRRKPRVLARWQLKWMLNLFPPFLFQRIRVVEIGAGFRNCKVRIARSLLTHNLNGTTFGGSIYAGADPMYAVMFWQIFALRGERIRVWLRSAQIRYLRPAATDVTFEFSVSEDQIQDVVERLDRDGRCSRSYRAEALDRDGRICATVDTEVYLRRPGRGQKEVSAF